jgi:hypothetical protein
VKGSFSVEGHLAFSMKDGITNDTMSLVNDEPFILDVQLGIDLEGVAPTIHDLTKKRVLVINLSPLRIPGIIIVGPQIAMTAEFLASLTGKAQILIGGTLSLSPGTAVLSLVNKEQNRLDGLNVTFTPVAKVSHFISIPKTQNNQRTS